jgi:hypothetical protein
MRRNLALRLTIYSPVSKWENPFPIVLHADDRPNFLAEFLPLASLLCRHLALDDADDGHEDGAAHTAAAHVGQDALQVETAAAGRRGSHYRLEDCAAHPPPTIPAMEFPRVPRLLSFIAAPATLPPTAPLIT